MDILSAKERSYRMSLVKSKGTKPERIVQHILKHLGCKYHSHFKKLPGCPDFVFSQNKKAIFVHGCFWHQHGICRRDHKPRAPKSKLGYWLKKLIRNKKRDLAIQHKLNKMGWSYFVIWECQTKNKTKFARLPERIKKFMTLDEN